MYLLEASFIELIAYLMFFISTFDYITKNVYVCKLRKLMFNYAENRFMLCRKLSFAFLSMIFFKVKDDLLQLKKLSLVIPW